MSMLEYLEEFKSLEILLNSNKNKLDRMIEEYDYDFQNYSYIDLQYLFNN
jgi:hypothetical protein